MLRLFTLLFLLPFVFLQAQKFDSLDTKTLFQQYLDDSSSEVFDEIINRDDGLYSLFCKGIVESDYQTQIDLFTEFISKDPEIGLSSAYIYRAYAYVKIGENIKAEEDLLQAEKLGDKSQFLCVTFGLVELILKKYDASIKYYSKAISFESGELISDAYFGRGTVYLALKDYENSLKDFEECIKSNPKYLLAYLYQATCLIELKRFDEAEEVVLKLEELDSINTYFNAIKILREHIANRTSVLEKDGK